MGARDLLADLADAGFSIAAEGDMLVIRPWSKLTDDMRSALLAAKREMLALLASTEADDAQADREAFEERAAILEYDARLPRHEAEAQARTMAASMRRTCAGCTHLTRRKTCAEPVEVGLAESFSIRWPEPGHARACGAFSPEAVVPMGDRPYRLSVAEGDVAHVESWDDAAIARFQARVGRLLRLGIHATDADDLAERLHLRDVQIDDRRLCIECSNLAGHVSTGWRCRSNRAAGVAADLPAVMVTTMQRCLGFRS